MSFVNAAQSFTPYFITFLKLVMLKTLLRVEMLHLNLFCFFPFCKYVTQESILFFWYKPTFHQFFRPYKVDYMMWMQTNPLKKITKKLQLKKRQNSEPAKTVIYANIHFYRRFCASHRRQDVAGKRCPKSSSILQNRPDTKMVQKSGSALHSKGRKYLQKGALKTSISYSFLTHSIGVFSHDQLKMTD